MHRQTGYFVLTDEYFTAFCLDQAYNHIKRGGFPCAVGAKQAHDFATVDLHGNIPDNPSPFVTFGEAFRP
jgi:hypothetical protein